MASIVRNPDGSASVTNASAAYTVPAPADFKQSVVVAHLASDDPQGPLMLAWNYGGAAAVASLDPAYAAGIGYTDP